MYHRHVTGCVMCHRHVTGCKANYGYFKKGTFNRNLKIYIGKICLKTFLNTFFFRMCATFDVKDPLIDLFNISNMNF